MSTNRSKATSVKPKRRSTPSTRIERRRRVQLQPLQGRHPVLPPIGYAPGWPPMPYQSAGQQNFMMPSAMTYPLSPFQQMVPYLPQSTIPANMLTSQPPPVYVAVPTSSTLPMPLCYYAPWPVYHWSEPTDVITAELLPDVHTEDELQLGAEDSQSSTLMYCDPMLLLEACEELCSEIVESVVADMAKEVVADCIDEMIKSYLGHACLIRTSSLERPRPKLVAEDVRPSTNPIVSCTRIQRSSVHHHHKKRQQSQLQPLTKPPHPLTVKVPGAGQMEGRAVADYKLKHLTRQVAEHTSQIILDELLFQQFLQVAVMGTVRKTSEALANSILNELLFDGLLKYVFDSKGEPSHSKPSVPISNQLL